MTDAQEAEIRRIAKLLDANRASSDHLLLAEVDALRDAVANEREACALAVAGIGGLVGLYVPVSACVEAIRARTEASE